MTASLEEIATAAMPSFRCAPANGQWTLTLTPATRNVDSSLTSSLQQESGAMLQCCLRFSSSCSMPS